MEPAAADLDRHAELQSGQFIEETIRPAAAGYPDLKYIIIDGGSTDQSVEHQEIRTLANRWVSEKYRGQAHAINKGFARHGLIFQWGTQTMFFLVNSTLS